jgi:drug/metabolite transporter (DMT)-like permease
MRLNKHISPFEIFTVSSFTQLIFNGMFMLLLRGVKKGTLEVKTKITQKQYGILILRLFLGFPAWVLLNYSVYILPLGVVQIIGNINPLLILAISYFILGESLRTFEVANILLCFCGALYVITQSTRDAGHVTPTSSS